MENTTNRTVDVTTSPLQQSLDFMGVQNALTKERERQLITLAQGKGSKAERAKNELVQSSILWVAELASKASLNLQNQNELYSAGLEGLAKSIEKFDLSSDCRFLTYATFKIKEAMNNCRYDELGQVRLPQNVAKLINKCRSLGIDEDGNYLVGKFAEDNNLTPEMACLIANYVEGCHFKNIDTTYDLSESDDDFLSDSYPDIDLPEGEQTSISDADMNAFYSMEEEDDRSKFHTKGYSEFVEDCLSILSPRDREIFKRYHGIYGEKESAKQLAAEFNMTESGILKCVNRATPKVQIRVTQKAA